MQAKNAPRAIQLGQLPQNVQGKVQSAHTQVEQQVVKDALESAAASHGSAGWTVIEFKKGAYWIEPQQHQIKAQNIANFLTMPSCRHGILLENVQQAHEKEFGDSVFAAVANQQSLRDALSALAQVFVGFRLKT